MCPYETKINHTNVLILLLSESGYHLEQTLNTYKSPVL